MLKNTESAIPQKGLVKTLIQFIKFGLVGASNTLISLAIYYLFVWIDRDLYLLGQGVGFLISVLNAYYWNNRYVFKGGRFWDPQKLLKTYAAYGGSTLLSLGLSIVEVELMHISEWIVPVINLLITIPLNFITHKFWVYRKQQPAGKRALITGATSMLGAATVRSLLDAGYTVTALIRPGTAKRDRLPERAGLTVREVALSDIPQAELPPCDVFFHFAWDATTPLLRGDEAAQRQNAELSLRSLEKAAKLSCKRFIFAGSQAEYGVHRERITEATPCTPVSAYGRAKLAFGQAGAQRARTLGMEFVHLRIFSVYGAEDRPDSLVRGCIRTFLSGGDMTLGPADQSWDYLYVSDFASLMTRMAGAERGDGLYNVASGDSRPLKAFIEEIHALCGGNGRCLYGKRPERPEGEVWLRPAIDSVYAAFGWKPEIPFAEGVQQMIETERKRQAI